MSKKLDLVKNTGIIAVGRFSTQLVSFLLLPLYTAYLSPSDYGFVDLVMTYAILFVPIITIQSEMAIFRFLIDSRADKNRQSQIVSNTVKLDILFVLLFSSISVIVNIFIKIPHFWLVLAYVDISVFSALFLQIARGLGLNNKYAKASIIVAISTLLYAYLFIVVFRLGIKGMLISAIISNLSCILYLMFSIKISNLVYLGSKNKNLQKQMIKYSAPLVPNTIAQWIVNVSDRTVVSIFMGLKANGIYAISGKFSIVLNSIFSIFLMSWTESISLHINDDDRDNYISDIFNKIVVFVSSAGLILISAITYLFPLFINMKYLESKYYIPIMIISIPFSSAMGMFGSIYIAMKMTRKVAITSVSAAVINLILTILLVPFIGIYGAIIGTIVAYASMVLLRYKDMKQYIAIRYNIKKFVILLMSYFIIILIYYLNNNILNVISLLLSTIIFVYLNKSLIYPILIKLKKMVNI